jgi:hypothetical protein
MDIRPGAARRALAAIANQWFASEWPLALSKPGVRDRTRAVLKAFELGLV